jgi:putative hydrolase of HD superfamily
MRRGWVKKLGMKRPESVADHSYRTALMAMVVSDIRGLDSGKAMRLALLHDLPESVVGDATPEERSGKSKSGLETKAMEEIVAGLPTRVKRLVMDSWSEYLDGKSEEAHLVRQLDKLEMAIQAREYSLELPDPSATREFWVSASKHVSDDDLVAILKKVEP